MGIWTNVIIVFLKNYKLFHLSRCLGTDHLTCRGGAMVFFSDNTRVRIFYFFCRSKPEIFFPEFNIRLYDKNSESDYFSSTIIRIFFQQHWESEYFFQKKKHSQLNGPSLTMHGAMMDLWKVILNQNCLHSGTNTPRLTLTVSKIIEN